MDPRLLRIFVAVMRYGSVTRSAEQLYTSQPSVSKALKRLEEVVGFRLFEPQGRGLTPTSKGKLLLEPALRVDRELEAVRQRAVEIKRGRSRGIRIASIPAIAAALLPRAIVAFRALWPGITLEIETGRRELVLSELDAERVDIGLLYSTTASAPVGFRIIASAPMLCVMPRTHRFVQKRIITPEDLRGEKMVVQHNSIDFADRLWRILTALDPPPDIVVEASQFAFLRDLVRQNVGISLLDGFTVPDAEMRGLVTRPFQPDLPSYLAIADRGQHMPVGGKEFIDVFSKIAANLEEN